MKYEPHKNWLVTSILALLSISDEHRTIPWILQEYKKIHIWQRHFCCQKIYFLGKKIIFCSVSSFESPCSHDVTLTRSKRRWNLSFYRSHHLRKSRGQIGKYIWKSHNFRISQRFYCIHRQKNWKSNQQPCYPILPKTDSSYELCIWTCRV